MSALGKKKKKKFVYSAKVRCFEPATARVVAMIIFLPRRRKLRPKGPKSEDRMGWGSGEGESAHRHQLRDLEAL